MERLKAALSEYDSYIQPCPVRNPKPRGRIYGPNDQCETCRSTASGNCGLEGAASYRLVQAVRRIVGDA